MGAIERLPAALQDRISAARSRYFAIDIPGIMVDRISSLYAEEERRERAARTEKLIKQAQSIQ